MDEEQQAMRTIHPLAAIAALLSAVLLAAEPKLPDAERQPLPAEEELAAARKAVEKEFEEQLAQDDQAAAAESLMDAAYGAADDPPRQFVLFSKSLECANEAAAREIAWLAIDQLGRRFEFDPLPAKAHSLEAVARKTRPVEAKADLARICLATIEEALAEERYEVAEKIGRVAGGLVSRLKDAQLREEVAAVRREIALLKRKARAAQLRNEAA